MDGEEDALLQEQTDLISLIKSKNEALFAEVLHRASQHTSKKPSGSSPTSAPLANGVLDGALSTADIDQAERELDRERRNFAAELQRLVERVRTLEIENGELRTAAARQSPRIDSASFGKRLSNGVLDTPSGDYHAVHRDLQTRLGGLKSQLGQLHWRRQMALTLLLSSYLLLPLSLLMSIHTLLSSLSFLLLSLL